MQTHHRRHDRIYIIKMSDFTFGNEITSESGILSGYMRRHEGISWMKPERFSTTSFDVVELWNV